ncbi:hypothetical protein, partial [Paenibacillus sonchi]|uniref:hypothetical protein n=1 Tax=Paenibacillus sonchi TaxID=373687 RepID=UPI000584B8E7
MSKNAEILEASEDISDAGGLGSIRGLKRTKADSGDRGALILPKTLFFQRIWTQEPLYRSMEP